MANQTNYNHQHRLKEPVRADFSDGELQSAIFAT